MSSVPSTLSPAAPRSFGRLLMFSLSRHWFLITMVLLAVWTGLPFVAPVAMHLGWTGLGTAIYRFYSVQCHQLPERSFFLFGRKVMYSLAEIQTAWVKTDDPLILRQFVGDEAMGWKVAWSDRMVALYTSIPLFALVYYPFRRKVRHLPIWAFLLLLMPIALDGGTHMLSDLAGIGHGFRDTNAWLGTLTGDVLPTWFYVGDALGSFNSWMRIVSGALSGFGAAWLAFPYLAEMLEETSGPPAFRPNAAGRR